VIRVVLAAALVIAAQTPSPLPAADGVIAALQDHRLVAITDPHGDANMQSFIRSLLADPRFATSVDDIVVEVGNARYQAMVDRYVTGGDVDEQTLADAWLHTTVPNQIWADIEWFRRVRAINRTRGDRPMRILLGDPPIDWSRVQTREEHLAFLAQRDNYPAALIRTEVIAKGRRALIIYGHLHFQRRNVTSNFEMDDWRMQTIVSLIEQSGPERVFTIWHLGDELVTIFPDASRWPRPAFARLKDTPLGAIDVSRLYPKRPRVDIVDGKLQPLPASEWASLRMEDQLDAVLYLAPAAEHAAIAPDPAPCRRPGFLEERLRRITLTGIPAFEAENIRRLCAQ
jgi:hypothetical protein